MSESGSAESRSTWRIMSDESTGDDIEVSGVVSIGEMVV